ncbi:adenylate kinase [Trifolium repens]|nr:adenylate kinase [Trifolium repens]
MRNIEAKNVMSRLKIYKQNAEAVSSSYSNITNKVTEDYFLICVMPIMSTNGMKSGEKSILDIKKEKASLIQDKWRGIPTRLNSTKRAINDGKIRLKLKV